jgi:hypothetical protein
VNWLSALFRRRSAKRLLPPPDPSPLPDTSVAEARSAETIAAADRMNRKSATVRRRTGNLIEDAIVGAPARRGMPGRHAR